AEGGCQAVLWDCFGLIELQDIIGEAAHSGEDAGIFSDSRGVFAERDIARVVGCVLDPPVLANRGSGGFGCEGAAGQIERGFEAGFPASCGGWKCWTVRSTRMMAATCGAHSVSATAGLASNTATARVSWRLRRFLSTLLSRDRGSAVAQTASTSR